MVGNLFVWFRTINTGEINVNMVIYKHYNVKVMNPLQVKVNINLTIISSTIDYLFPVCTQDKFHDILLLNFLMATSNSHNVITAGS